MWSINHTTRTPANPEPDAHESPHMWSICLSLSSSLSKGSSASGCVAWTSHWASTNLTHVFWSPAQCFIAGLAWSCYVHAKPKFVLDTMASSVYHLVIVHCVICTTSHKAAFNSKECHRQIYFYMWKNKTAGPGYSRFFFFLSRPTSKFWHVLPLTQLWTLRIYCFTSSFISTWKQAHSPGSGLICDQGRCVYHTTSPQALTVPH